MSTPSSSVANTFFALPSYSSCSATFKPPLQVLYPLEDDVDVAQRVGGVEEVPEVRAEVLAHLLLLLQQLPEAPLPLPRLHRRSLDHRVGVVATHASLDERQEDAPGEDDAATQVEVAQHPVLVDLEPVQDARCGPEHVVGQDRGVGQHDALRRG